VRKGLAALVELTSTDMPSRARGTVRVSSPKPSLHFPIYTGEQFPTRCNGFPVSLQKCSALFPSFGLSQQRANPFRVRRRLRKLSAKRRIKAKSFPQIRLHVGSTTRRLHEFRRFGIFDTLRCSRYRTAVSRPAPREIPSQIRNRMEHPFAQAG
jgi:hypothetical protein